MHGGARRRSLLSLLLAAVLIALVTPSAEARPSWRFLGFRTDPVSVSWGSTVHDAVRVAPARRGTVLVQARRAGSSGWATLSRTSLASSGRARVALVPQAPGTWQFRLVVRASAGRPRVVSGTRIVRATSPALSAVAWTSTSFTVDRGVRRNVSARVSTGTSTRPRLVSLVRQSPGEQGWTTVATATTDQLGRVTFGYSAPKPGSALLRVLAYATPSAQEAWSSVRTMRVLPAVVEGTAGAVQVISAASDGAWSGVAFSADSAVVAYIAGGSATTVPQAWVWDRRTDARTLASATPDGRPAPWPVFAGNPTGVRELALSPDGTKVAFTTDSVEIVAGDTQYRAQVYVRDLRTGAVEVVSKDTRGDLVGGQDPVFSPDSNHLAFASGAPRIVGEDGDDDVDVFEADLAAGSIRLVSRSVDAAVSDGGSSGPTYSPDGRMLAFRTDDSTLVRDDPHNGQAGVVMEVDGALALVSSGAAGDGCSSVSGTAPAFSPDSSHLAYAGVLTCPGEPDAAPQAVVVDLAGGTTSVASSLPDGTWGDRGSGGSFSWSADGRQLAFVSTAPNLTGAEFDRVTLVKDLQTGALVRGARTPAGDVGDGVDSYAAFAGAGSRLMLVSTSQNLGSTTMQAYVGTVADGLSIATRSADGVPGDSATVAAWLAPNGRALIASSYSGSLVGDGDHRLRTYLIQLD